MFPPGLFCEQRRLRRRCPRLRPRDRGRVARVLDLGAVVDPHGLCTNGAEELCLLYLGDRICAIRRAQAKCATLAACRLHAGKLCKKTMR